MSAGLGLGYSDPFYPEVSITHLGGQSVGRFPVRFAIEVCRNGYRYFYKHYGSTRCPAVSVVMILAKLRIRQAGYGFAESGPSQRRGKSAAWKCIAPPMHWNKQLDPIQFVEHGIEQQVSRSRCKLPETIPYRTSQVPLS